MAHILLNTIDMFILPHATLFMNNSLLTTPLNLFLFYIIFIFTCIYLYFYYLILPISHYCPYFSLYYFLIFSYNSIFYTYN